MIIYKTRRRAMQDAAWYVFKLATYFMIGVAIAMAVWSYWR